MKTTKSLLNSSSVLPLLLILFSSLFFTNCKKNDPPKFPNVKLEPGYKLEKVVSGLSYPTSLTWDDHGKMYVAEAGGGLPPNQLAPARILKIEDGKAIPIIDLSSKGIGVAVVGLVWYNGAFYFTHKNSTDNTGSVSRVTPDGALSTILAGLIDSKSEHQINDIKVGPDGKMYVTLGLAANAAVVGADGAPWLKESPDMHATACYDIVLRGLNYKGLNPLTMDTVLTGAYVPIGTVTQPGQVIKGTNKCGGSILMFDPANAEGTLSVYAWGFRNPIGISWNKKTGEMYLGENGYDIRGVRPVNDEYDATLKVTKGEWYGIPDYSAAREPLTMAKFKSPDNLMAEVFLGSSQPLGKVLDFVIDHAASGLTAPDPASVIGLHPVNASPSMLDVAPESWGKFSGDVFVAEWGDLAPPTNPLRNQSVGSRIVRLSPGNQQPQPFVSNKQPGPASEQGKEGKGLERPFDVQFGPDGAMYIVDYGVVNINMALKPPYDSKAGTGVIWKVTKRDDNERDDNDYEE